MLYRWKAKLLKESGPAATTLENRGHELEDELRRVVRDILKTRRGIAEEELPNRHPEVWRQREYK